MPDLIIRKGKLFSVNKDVLSSKANKSDIINALYFALFQEFAGAVRNDKYKNETNQQKISLMNSFAYNWLKERNLL